ncbi:MAG: DUF1150 family protein [Jannaschia helgolandensis]|jgi:hypothetical protein|uniref:DUF1150 family protein n=1 Tax=Jannaschia helgolandensis TaxID=188906 RepID=A0A1H7R4A1_9RHOB|nr:DUF1150 family protein [Jannaschia helgolandensis]SEL55090.1 hypothetical protein SAMN04488526_2937 [Jannaschia helgolandensis]|tara:strand:- start:743 stop:973 length:231 start_codon:yes stop_codon:yes gene_type:complete
MTQLTDIEALGGSLVYVRRVQLDDLPSDVQDEAREGGLDELYALHRADGEQVALVGDRSLAFNLARQNDLTPVSVH